jgi:Zn-dependent metalloprotease
MVNSPRYEESDLYTTDSALCRNPLHCIVPPHILEKLARTGDQQRREVALDTLMVSQSFINARIVRGQVEGARRALPPARLFARQRRAIRSARGRGRLAAALEFTKQRVIYSAQNHYRIPGVRVRSEGQAPTNDTAVDEAYDGLGATFDFYAEAYGRNSIDDHGMELDGTVHYGRNYDNAYWDGQRMIFGDGDGQTFDRFTTPVDVMGHELTHGVTQYEVPPIGLIYSKQSGALNESISDAFGSLVKQYTLKQTADQADWLIGQGLVIGEPALRSLKDPGSGFDPQPSNMQDYVNTAKDNGGVHINSGIPNHAFYLAATAIGDYAWQGAGLIWYLTLPLVPPTAQFQDFARATLGTAQGLFGVNSAEAEAVGTAWAAVGVNV